LHELEGRDGWSVMEILRDGGLDIAAECGGACACATCHVYIDPAWSAKLEPREDMEEGMLETAWEPKQNSRLSCQVHVTAELDGMQVTVPRQQRET
jgi:2Fe-2S ferredoxin